MKTLEWELEDDGSPHYNKYPVWHLKVVIPRGTDLRPYKITCGYVQRMDEIGSSYLAMPVGEEEKWFDNLEEAKAWTFAVKRMAIRTDL